MKISLLMICLLVSSTLLHEAQGIRIAKTSISEGNDKKVLGKSRDGKAVVCKRGDCSAAAAAAGMIRKLKTKLKVKKSRVPEKEEVLDIDEMDYSRARKKSPIHN